MKRTRVRKAKPAQSRRLRSEAKKAAQVEHLKKRFDASREVMDVLERRQKAAAAEARRCERLLLAEMHRATSFAAKLLALQDPGPIVIDLPRKRVS